MPFPPRPLPFVPPYGTPPPPPPPPPPVRHPTLWPQDFYTREEVNAKDAATLEAAKRHVGEAVASAVAREIGDAVDSAKAAKEAAEKAAASADSSAEDASSAAAHAAAEAVAGARRVVESVDGEKNVTVTDGGEAILRGGGVRIVFRFTGDAEETTLYRYGDTDWYLPPGATPPTGEDIQAFPTPCAQFGSTYKVLYRKENGTVIEYGLYERFNSSSYLIYKNGSVGTWRFEGCDSAGIVTRADLRRIARGCNDAAALLTALRNLLD